MEITKRLNRVAPSATLAAGEKARRLREQGVDVVDLGPGQPRSHYPSRLHVTPCITAEFRRKQSGLVVAAFGKAVRMKRHRQAGNRTFRRQRLEWAMQTL